MGVWASLWLRRTTDNRQQTTDLWAVAGLWASLMLRSTTVNGQQTTDLWAVADCSPLSVDCSLPKKPKLRRCRPLLTPVSPVFPPYRGILKGDTYGVELRRCRQVEPTFWVVVGCFKTTRLQDHKWAVAGLLFPKTGQNRTKRDKTGQNRTNR